MYWPAYWVVTLDFLATSCSCVHKIVDCWICWCIFVHPLLLKHHLFCIGYNNIFSFCKFFFLFFVPLWIDWVFRFLFCFFFLFRSFCNQLLNVFKFWWVSLGVHCCLFFIWKGRFSWSVFDSELITLKWVFKV